MHDSIHTAILGLCWLLKFSKRSRSNAVSTCNRKTLVFSNNKRQPRKRGVRFALCSSYICWKSGVISRLRHPRASSVHLDRSLVAHLDHVSVTANRENIGVAAFLWIYVPFSLEFPGNPDRNLDCLEMIKEWNKEEKRARRRKGKKEARAGMGRKSGSQSQWSCSRPSRKKEERTILGLLELEETLEVMCCLSSLLLLPLYKYIKTEGGN